MKRRILCLYLPNWPIQRLFAALKKHLQQPVVLHARDPRRGDVVVVCNTAAGQRGVRLDMPLAEAATLAEHGGECLILPHDPAADLAELARLAEHCERFSPLVGWKVQGPKSKAQSQKTSYDLGPGTLDFGPQTGPDCLFFDVTGIGLLFGGEEILAREAINDLVHQGYEARVAIADTIGAAWALSTQADGPAVQVLSTDYSVLSTEPFPEQPPDSQLSSTPNLQSEICNLQFEIRNPSAFRNLPLRTLRLPEPTIDLLSQLGITRLEELLVLPRESLRARFGELLLLRIDQLLGAAQEIIVPHRPPPQFTEEWVLEYPAEGREIVERIIDDLLHRIATALANRREGVLKLACRLDCAPGRPVRIEIGLFRPSADEKHLRELAQMQLEQTALPGAIGRVRLEATLTAPLENRQGELFAGNQHEAERQLALLIDRCSSRLGPQAVLRPQLTTDPLPERAVRYKAGVRSQGSEVRGRKSTKRRTENQPASHFAFRTPHSAFFRPLMLLSPPQPLDVLSIAPDGPPVSFRLHRQKHEVTASSGPERIETGWWRGKSVRRDYWRVETTKGQRFWLFRNIGTSDWHLHGEYS